MTDVQGTSILCGELCKGVSQEVQGWMAPHGAQWVPSAVAVIGSGARRQQPSLASQSLALLRTRQKCSGKQQQASNWELCQDLVELSGRDTRSSSPAGLWGNQLHL